MTLDAIDRMVRQANPVPDPTVLEPTDLDVGSVRLDDDDLDGAELVVIHTRRAAGQRSPRRHWLVAAAAVLAVVVGAVLVRVVTDDAPTQEPTNPIPSPTTALTPSGGAATLPPPGATPSSPENGELVASVVISGRPDGGGAGSFNLFADGRLIRLGISLAESPDDDGPDEVVEQRLTADGVEQVRAEFLASGLFDADQPLAELDLFGACGCWLQARVNGRLVTPGSSATPAPNWVDRVNRLVDYVVGLDSSLPPSAWDDRTIRPYVPSRYQACAWGLPDSGGDYRPLSDVVAVLARRVPAAVARLFTVGRSCAVLTLDETRRLAEALDEARTVDDYLPGWFSTPTGLQYRFYDPELSEVGRDGSTPLVAVGLTVLLPDGQPPASVGG
jgi:hypothetical protein